MSAKIRLVSEAVNMTATLNDSKAAAAVYAGLPIEGMAQTIGASVYFLTNLSILEENAVEEVEPGTVAYWPATSSLCVFYGSQPTTPVMVVGKLDGDLKPWRKVLSGTTIRAEKG